MPPVRTLGVAPCLSDAGQDLQCQAPVDAIGRGVEAEGVVRHTVIVKVYVDEYRQSRTDQYRQTTVNDAILRYNPAGKESNVVEQGRLKHSTVVTMQHSRL